jgi:hypothetical protein
VLERLFFLSDFWNGDRNRGLSTLYLKKHCIQGRKELMSSLLLRYRIDKLVSATRAPKTGAGGASLQLKQTISKQFFLFLTVKGF